MATTFQIVKECTPRQLQKVPDAGHVTYERKSKFEWGGAECQKAVRNRACSCVCGKDYVGSDEEEMSAQAGMSFPFRMLFRCTKWFPPSSSFCKQTSRHSGFKVSEVCREYGNQKWPQTRRWMAKTSGNSVHRLLSKVFSALPIYSKFCSGGSAPPSASR